jgi:hypothetical protein
VGVGEGDSQYGEEDGSSILDKAAHLVEGQALTLKQGSIYIGLLCWLPENLPIQYWPSLEAF